jgi:hypothetical protein
MASAEKKGEDELKDQQAMGSNANGAEGAEGKTGESNLSGKDPACLLVLLSRSRPRWGGQEKSSFGQRKRRPRR